MLLVIAFVLVFLRFLEGGLLLVGDLLVLDLGLYELVQPVVESLMLLRLKLLMLDRESVGEESCCPCGGV
jgi:hypothetical protein